MRSALDALDIIGRQEARISASMRHLEIYTMHGLLTVLWHGDPTAERVVIMCGGAMGGLLGPAHGTYQVLGDQFVEQGIATMRVGYRRPNDLDSCTHDLCAAAELAARAGAERFVTVGHSFGGAPALRTGIILGTLAAGVVLLATQSAGCEEGELLGDVPVLLMHGDRDEILPLAAAETVRMIIGHGELVVLPGTGHLLVEATDTVRSKLGAWIPERFS
jgi:hypothetical protein